MPHHTINMTKTACFWEAICSFLPAPLIGTNTVEQEAILERDSPEWFIAWDCLDYAFQQEFGEQVGRQLANRFACYKGSDQNHIFTLKQSTADEFKRRGVNLDRCLPAQTWRIPAELVSLISSLAQRIFKDRLARADESIWPDDVLTVIDRDSIVFGQTLPVNRVGIDGVYLTLESGGAYRIPAYHLSFSANPSQWSIHQRKVISALVIPHLKFPTFSPQP